MKSRFFRHLGRVVKISNKFLPAGEPARITFNGAWFDQHSELLLGPTGDPITLRAKSLEVFKYLMRHPNRVITKEELLNEVWQDTSNSRRVDEDSIIAVPIVVGQAHSISMNEIFKIGISGT